MKKMSIKTLINKIENCTERKAKRYIIELANRINDLRNNEDLRVGTTDEELFIYKLLDMGDGEIEHYIHDKWFTLELYKIHLAQFELELRTI